MNYSTKSSNKDLFHSDGNATQKLAQQRGVASGKITLTDPHAKARVTEKGLKKIVQKGWNS